MDFTHGRRENRFYTEKKLEEEKNIYERSSTGGGDVHRALPTTTSVSSTSSDIFLHYGSDASPSSTPATGLPTPASRVETEQMFEKVVTPSDVGKLNRLVIPKQHAEKYFPIDASAQNMGLLLNFEDRTGKRWRFRYSYWNSSQSYVMTKGWSRFVKENRLDAGDTVSFGRGVGGAASDRLFIDWKRRTDRRLLNPSAHNHPYVSFSRSAATPWAASRLFVHRGMRSASIAGGPQNNQGGTAGGRPAPMVLDSVPVAADGKAADATKRVRLFGVNLEQPKTNAESTGVLRLQFRSPLSSTDLHLREVDSSPSASSFSSSTRGEES